MVVSVQVGMVAPLSLHASSTLSFPVTGGGIVWVSNNPAVASVEKGTPADTALVTGVSVGMTTVRVQVNGAEVARITINVTQNDPTVSFSITSP